METDFDIEDIIIPPYQLYNKEGGISVTELSSQIWCEQELELKLSTGLRFESAFMKSGILRHEQLEKEDHDSIECEVTTREEIYGIKLLNTIILIDQILEKKKARELWICGFHNNLLLKGIIDELRIVRNKDNKASLLISDTKTRQSPTEPSLSQKRSTVIQLQTYYVLLCALQGGHFTPSLQLRAMRGMRLSPNYEFTNEPLKSLGTMKNAFAMFSLAWQKLPVINDQVEFVYECNGEEFKRDYVDMSMNGIMFTLNDLSVWWEGGREAIPVGGGEVWKCTRCNFLALCGKTRMEPERKKEVLEERERVKREGEGMGRADEEGKRWREERGKRGEAEMREEREAEERKRGREKEGEEGRKERKRTEKLAVNEKRGVEGILRFFR